MTRAQRNITFVVIGLGVIAFVLISGLRTANGGLDWVDVITAAAGLVLVFIGLLLNLFHHGTT